MTSMSDLAETLHSINTSSFQGDEISRMQVFTAAQKLVNRLEQPWERAFWMFLLQPIQMVCFKTASDVKLWSHLNATPQSSSQLAAKTGFVPDTLRRILRVLVTIQIVEEPDIDKYVETDFTRAFAVPDGLIKGLDMYYMMGLRQMERVPEYFKQHEYRMPKDIHQAMWKWVKDMPDYPGGFWEMTDETGFSPVFNSFLSAVRVGQPPWPRLWPVKERLLDGWNGKSVLLVDVGGGKGRDISYLAEVIHDTHPNARLVLQDRPGVIEEAKATGLHPQVETVPHDFFKPNPIHGARAYFEHSVIHDWPDKESREILLNMKSAMIPGYSKIMMVETVMPERAKEVDPRIAAMDLQMGFNFCALERTLEQWKELLQSVGLKFVDCRALFAKTCMIEAEL